MTYVVRRKQPRHDGTRYYNDRGPCARDPNGGAEYDSAEEADAARRGLREPHLLGFEEYAARQQALDERATFLQRRRPLSREDAYTVALFSRGTWAQRYPVRSHDLGKDCATFVADWLSARHVEPTAENMDAALQEWHGGAFVARIWAAVAGLR